MVHVSDRAVLRDLGVLADHDAFAGCDHRVMHDLHAVTEPKDRARWCFDDDAPSEVHALSDPEIGVRPRPQHHTAFHFQATTRMPAAEANAASEQSTANE